MSEEKGYISDNSGLFIALTSLPNEHQDDFLANELSLFSEYQKGVVHHAQCTEEEANNYKALYFKPESYVCWGRYDIAHICLTDDLEFASKVFRPYNPLKARFVATSTSKTETDEHFAYQVIFGPTPKFKGKPSLEERAKDTFLRKEHRYPYIAICQFKLSNALLIGGAGHFFQEVLEKIERYIHDYVTELPSDLQGPPHLGYLLNASFSYQEIVLVIFGTRYDQMMKLALEIREFRFIDLCLNKKQEQRGMAEEEFDKLARSTLAYQLAHQPKEQTNQSESKKGKHRTALASIRHNHIFENSLTTLGYHLHLFTKDETKPDDLQFLAHLDDPQLKLQTRWFIKPGHLSTFVQKLPKEDQRNQDSGTETIQLTIGKGDLIYPNLNETDDVGPFRDTRKKVEFVFRSDQLRPHFKESFTLPTFTVDRAYIEGLPTFEDEEHFKMHKELKKLEIPLETISAVKGWLKRLGMPSVLSEKIMTIISTFNVTIQDPLLYVYFVELRPFVVNTLIKTLSHFASALARPDFKAQEAEKILFFLTNVFESGFRNRYFQSFWTSDMTEINLDHRGGIQGILTAWDMVYKSLSRPLGELSGKSSFVFVSGYSGVISSEYALRLNYSHIFTPSIYLSIAGHEAANHFLKKLVMEKEVFAQADDPYRLELLLEYYALVGLKAQVVPAIEYYPENKPVFIYNPQAPIFKQFDIASRVFLHHLTSEFYRYLIVDTITYFYCYNEDPALFWHYSWGYLLQMANTYDRPGKVNPHIFMVMLMRTIFILSRFDKNFDANKLCSPAKVLDELWNKYAAKCSDFAQLLLKINFGKTEGSIDASCLHDWMGYFEGLAQEVVISAHKAKQPEKGDLGFSSFSGMSAEQRKKEYEERRKLINRITNQYIDIFRKGQFPIFSSSQITNTSFVVMLIYSYLKLIKNFALDDADGVEIEKKPKDILLQRNRISGNVEPIDKENAANLLFDTVGGYFIHDLNKRREFFQYRTSLMKSFWNMAMKEKAEMIVQLLKVDSVS
jgi:hypothetical protein